MPKPPKQSIHVLQGVRASGDKNHTVKKMARTEKKVQTLDSVKNETCIKKLRRVTKNGG